jgi:DUF917 family protein
MPMQLDSANLQALARGCGALAAGGGGDPAMPLLMALRAVEQHGPVTVVDLAELETNTLVLPCGIVGSPMIAEERIWTGGEGRTLSEAVERVRDQPVGALMAFNVAGGGALLTATWAAHGDLPIVDAEGMGRAFPGLDQQAMNLAGVSPSPQVLTDGRGNTLLLDPADDAWAQRLAGGTLAGLGGVCAGALYCMTGEQAARATIAGSITRALRVGRALDVDPGPARLSAVSGALGGSPLLEGRIHDVQRRVEGGVVDGSVTVLGTGSDAGRRVRLEFQSEFLLALEDGAVRAAVPELISVLLVDSCVPVPTEGLREGQRVTLMASPASAVWRSREGMALVGPSAFGYEVELAPRGEAAEGG